MLARVPPAGMLPALAALVAPAGGRWKIDALPRWRRRQQRTLALVADWPSQPATLAQLPRLLLRRLPAGVTLQQRQLRDLRAAETGCAEDTAAASPRRSTARPAAAALAT